MSLKGGGWGKLGSAHPNARDREPQPGGSALPCRGARRYLRLGGTHIEAAELFEAESGRQRAGSPVRDENDGAEPGTSDAHDRAVRKDASGSGHPISAAPVCTHLHSGGCSATGGSRSSPWTAD